MRRLLLIGCCMAGAADAADLGRLFTTPAQRSALERGQPVDPTPDAPGAPRAPATARDDAVTVQGILKRRGGAEIIWVNGHPLAKGESAGGIKLLDASRTRAVVLPANAKDPVTLKPGERWTPDGETEGIYRTPTAPAPDGSGEREP